MGCEQAPVRPFNPEDVELLEETVCVALLVSKEGARLVRPVHEYHYRAKEAGEDGQKAFYCFLLITLYADDRITGKREAYGAGKSISEALSSAIKGVGFEPTGKIGVPELRHKLATDLGLVMYSYY